MLIDYYLLIIFVIFFFILGFFLLCVSYLISPKKNDMEKLSAYECGFNAFNDARSGYYVSFYIVALLYILFDIELTLLFPWGIYSFYQDVFSFQVMVLFLSLLIVGFVFEYLIGALEWR